MDVQGSVEFAERLLTCGSDAEILSVKGVTLRRLTSLAESSYDAHPATVAPDDGSSISFMPRELAGEVEGYPVVGVINSKTVDLNKCTVEGEGKLLLNANMFYIFMSLTDVYSIQSCFCFVGAVTGRLVGLWRGSGRDLGEGFGSSGAVKDYYYLPGCLDSAEIPETEGMLRPVDRALSECLHTNMARTHTKKIKCKRVKGSVTHAGHFGVKRMTTFKD